MSQAVGEMQAFDVRRFGAKGDGIALDTTAVQAAIDACNKAGGGAVVFAPGLTFLVGTIYLKDHVQLEVQTNSTILGSDNLTDYGKDVGLNPFWPETIDPCLIFAKNATDIGIRGHGRIVGHTKNNFVAPIGVTGRDAQERPMLIRFDTCSEISIADISMYHCGAWCMHLKNSREIFLRSIHIQNDKQDGFDLDSCQNVSISDCHLECGDDAIAITTSIKDAPAQNIAIANCLLKSRCAGIRFGPLSKGDFQNITVSNCVFYDCFLGGIKLGVFEGAAIHDCVFDNLVMNNVTAPISMFIATWPEIGSQSPNPPMMGPGKIRDLQFRGIRAVTRMGPPNGRPDSGSVMFFHGHPSSSIENILLRDVSITFPGGGTREQAARRDIVDMDKIDYRKDGYWTDHKSTWGVPPAYGLYARHVNGLALENVSFQLTAQDARSAVFLIDSEHVRISQLKVAGSPGAAASLTVVNCVGIDIGDVEADPKAEILVQVEGASSSAINIEGNRSASFLNAVAFANGANDASVRHEP